MDERGRSCDVCIGVFNDLMNEFVPCLLTQKMENFRSCMG